MLSPIMQEVFILNIDTVLIVTSKYVIFKNGRTKDQMEGSVPFKINARKKEKVRVGCG